MVGQIILTVKVREQKQYTGTISFGLMFLVLDFSEQQIRLALMRASNTLFANCFLKEVPFLGILPSLLLPIFPPGIVSEWRYPNATFLLQY